MPFDSSHQPINSRFDWPPTSYMYLSKLVSKLRLYLEVGGEDTQGNNKIEMLYSSLLKPCHSFGTLKDSALCIEKKKKPTLRY